MISDSYYYEIIEKFSSAHYATGYGCQGLALILNDQLTCHFNDLAINRRVVCITEQASANGVDIFDIDDEEGDLDWGIILTAQQIDQLRADLISIDRDEVARKGALPSRWFELMLARRHDYIRQSEVHELLQKAFAIQEECVYVDGRPQRNKADIELAAGNCLRFTDDQITELRDLAWDLYPNKLHPRLINLIERREDCCQSVAVDIADYLVKERKFNFFGI